MRSRYLIPAAILCAVATALASAQEGERKLVGYWPFEEREGLKVEDASGSGHLGEILNAAQGVKRVTGRRGGALEFSGGDPNARNQAGCVALPGFDQVDWAKGMTVEMWVCLTKLDRPATYELVSNTVSDRGPGWRFVIFWQSLVLRTGDGEKTWGAGTEPSLTQLKTGEWCHLAGTYDGSVFRVYADGVLAGESQGKQSLTRGDNTLYLGAYRGGYAYGLNALVDDLRLYNYARTPAQIILDARLGD